MSKTRKGGRASRAAILAREMLTLHDGYSVAGSFALDPKVRRFESLAVQLAKTVLSTTRKKPGQKIAGVLNG